MPENPMLFIGIGGMVLALDRDTGQEVWRSGLKGADFVNVAIVDGALYATTRGEIFCLDPATGQIRWNNELKGLGRGLVTVAPGGSGIAVSNEKRRRDRAAAGAAAAGAAAASR